MNAKRFAIVAVIMSATLAASASVGCKDSTPPTLTTPTPSAVPAASSLPLPANSGPATADTSDRFPLNDDELAKIINPSGATGYTGPTGVVEGVVKVSGDPPKLHHFAITPKECESAENVHGWNYRVGPKGQLADALVAVIGYAPYVRPSREDKVVTIRKCAIEPTVIDLSLGQRLLVANDDDTPWAPQLAARSVVTRLTLKGHSPPPVLLTEPGAFALTWIAGLLPGADVPSAIIFVLPNALHTVTDREGKFRITGVPVGKVRVTSSHVSMPEAAKDIEIKAGEVHTVVLDMTYKEVKTTKPKDDGQFHPN